MKSKKVLILSSSICLIFLLALLPFTKAGAEQSTVKYDVGGTNMTQGCYHNTVALCTIVSRYSSKATLIPKVTTSPTGNLRLIAAGKMPLGYVSESSCYAAIRGMYPFKKKIRSNLRMLFCDQGYTYPIIASSSSGIKSVPDLKGKKVAGWARSSIYGKAAFLSALEAYGVAKEDVTILEGKSSGECKRMLQEGIVHAASFPVTPNSAKVVDLLANKPCIFIPISPEINKEIVRLSLNKYNTLVKTMTIPANTYEGQTQDMLYAGSPDGWAGTTNIDSHIAYDIAKTLFEHEDEFLALQPGKKGLKGVTHKTAVSAMFAIPYYPGAVRYYKEKGWWTSEMDAKQQQVLAEVEKLAEK